MAARIEQAAIVMLAMNLDKKGAKLADERGGDGLIVDEGAAMRRMTSGSPGSASSPLSASSEATA
jgi:hypothetical protein